MASRRRITGVDQLPSGRWRARYTDPTGRQRTAGIYSTKAEAEAARAVQITSKSVGTWQAPEIQTERLGDYMTRWFELRATIGGSKKMRATTAANYWTLAARFVNAPLVIAGQRITLGEYPLCALTPTLINEWFKAVAVTVRADTEAAHEATAARSVPTDTAAARTWARSAGCDVTSTGRLSGDLMDAWRAAGSPRTLPTPSPVREGAGEQSARAAYIMLRAVLGGAVREQLLQVSPAQVEGGSTNIAPERQTATDAQIDALASAMPAPLSALVPVTAWGCLRRGEVLGLQRRDVTLRRDAEGEVSGAHLAIVRAVVVVKGVPEIGPPKTQAGIRIVSLPRQAAVALADHMDRFTGPGSEDHVFTDARGGFVDPNNLGRTWRRVTREVGLPDLHLHDLRHTGASALAQTGAPLSTLMRQLGHRDMRAAMIYQHANIDDLDRAADALGTRLSGD